jgi:hypothetical protein
MSQLISRFAKGLLVLAGTLVVAFVLVLLLGWREHAATLLAGSGSHQDALRGALFIGAHLASVLLVPALLLAAALHTLASRLFGPERIRSKALPTVKG